MDAPEFFSGPEGHPGVEQTVVGKLCESHLGMTQHHAWKHCEECDPNSVKTTTRKSKREVVEETEGEDKPRESQAKERRRKAFIDRVPELVGVFPHLPCPTEHDLTIAAPCCTFDF